MKKILLSTAALFGAFIFANAQINVAVTSGPTQILLDGTMDAPMVVTVSNIPMGLDGNDGTVTINSRVYPDDNNLLGGGHKGQFAGADFTLFDITPDVDTATLKTETTLNSPAAGFFTRVFTIKQYGALSSAVGDIVDFSLRVINHTNPTPELTFDPAQEAGGQATRAILRISQDVEVVAVLSTSDVINISDSIYPNPVSSTLNLSSSIKTKTYKIVNLLGKTVKDVKFISGSIDVSDLSAGIYILKTDAGIAKFVKK